MSITRSRTNRCRLVFLFAPVGTSTAFRMKFSALATVALGAEVALAARWTEKRWERHAARAASRQTNPLLPATDADGLEIDSFNNETAHEEYSSNWAGAVLIGTGYKSVTGTFVVPTPSKPSGGSSSTEVSGWISKLPAN